MFPNLTTNRFLLDEFQVEDLDFVFKALSHPEVIRYYGVHYHSLKATKAQMDYFQKLFTEKTGLWWKIVDKANGKPLGAIGMYHYQQQHSRAEIGYWLLPEHWGRGVVSEALQVVIDYLLTVWKIHRIEALVEEGNSSSIRVLERAGFTHEGTMRDCELKDGKYITLLMFSLLSTDKQES